MRVSHHVKRSVCLLLSLLLLAQGMTLGAAAVGTDSVPAGTSVLEPAAYPDSEVLVLYEDGRTEVVVYEDAASLEEGLPQLARQEGVALVQPNYTYTSTALSTTDPLLAEQWALYNDGSFQLEEQENPYPLVDAVRCIRREHRNRAGRGRRGHRRGGCLGPVRRRKPGCGGGPGGHRHRLHPR